MIVRLREGFVIHGAWPDCLPDVEEVVSEIGRVAEVIADPPYCNIVDEKWDKSASDVDASQLQIAQAKHCARVCLPGAAMYWFGGYGKPVDRTWYRFVIGLEEQTEWRMAMPITWSKKRAYGVQHNYLSTREEIAYCVLGDIKRPRVFNIPLTDIERGYAGYNKKYPAKSKFKRRTAVWEVSEIFRGKRHPCQKPIALLKIPIEANTNPGEVVFDPFAGSGSTGAACIRLGRKFILVERDRTIFDGIVKALPFVR